MLRYLFRTIPPSKWLGAFLLSFSTLTQVCARFGNDFCRSSPGLTNNASFLFVFFFFHCAVLYDIVHQDHG